MAVMQKIKELFVPTDFEESEAIGVAPLTSYKIHTLTEKNLKEVLSLNLRCFRQGENYTKQIFKYLLTDPQILSYKIVTAEKRIAGFIFISFKNESVGHITTIGIAPEHRKRGLAKKLLEHAENSLRKKGFDSIVLEVRVSNYIAQNLYHRLDYTIIQKIYNYYGNDEDAYLMSKNL